MSKRTFLIFMANGDSHTVEADKLLTTKGEVSLLSDGRQVAYFNNVSAVVAKPEPAPAPVLVDPLPVAGSVADFEPRPTVQIGTVNITCPSPHDFTSEIYHGIFREKHGVV